MNSGAEAGENSAARGQTWLDQYWPRVVGAVLFVVAAVLGLLWFSALFDHGYDAVWPWAALVGALVCAVAALVAFSAVPRAGTSWIGTFWSIPVGVMLLVVAAICVVAAIVDVRDYQIADIAPWLFGAAAAVCMMLALVAFSYAPPGPNWIERMAGIDGASVLLIIGAAMTAFGTWGLFDFKTDGEDPSNWWVAIVAAGFVIALVGIARGDKEDDSLDALRFLAEEAASNASEARDSSVRAEGAYEQSLTLPFAARAKVRKKVEAAKESASRAATRAAAAAQEAETAAKTVQESAMEAAKSRDAALAGAKDASDALRHVASWPPPEIEDGMSS